MLLGIGVLGFAHAHVGMYLKRWQANHADAGEAAVVAGWDHDGKRLEQAVQQHAIQACSSPQALLERADIQAVVIGAETSRHAELVELAAAARKIIVLQKPMALTLGEADRIVVAVERAGVPFTVAWQMRVDPQNIKMKELIEAGTIGRVLMVRRRHGLSTHLWKGFAESWHVQPELNRGMWADDAAHAVDFLLWLLGEPVSVVAEVDTLVSPKIPDDHGIAIFRYANGVFAEVMSSFTCVAGENTTEIVGEKGVIIQNFGDAPSAGAPRPPGAVALKWFVQGATAWEISDLAAPASQGERIVGLAHPLLEFMQGRRPPVATAQEGRVALRMMLASYAAAEQGRRVMLKEL